MKQTPVSMTCPSPNQVYQFKDFYISYNYKDHDIYGCETTALVIGNMEKFLILDGDHREQYEPLVEKGLDSCLEYFNNNIHLKNKYSE